MDSKIDRRAKHVGSIVILMGNVRTKDIKKASHQLIGMFPDRFNKDFENNKEVMQEMKLVESKIMRNKIAGYITRLKTQRRYSQ